MEFSFTITEREFREAWRVERKASSRSSLKTALFWIFVMLGLLLIYRVMVPKDAPQGNLNLTPATQTSQISTSGEMAPKANPLQRVSPFLVLAGLWILIVTGLVPMRLKYLYRKDPRMQGKFTVSVTPDGVSTDNSAGTTAKTGWNVYECWTEGKDVIVLMFLSGSYSILSLAGLAASQQNELRGLLATALPKR